ncbi:MAG: nucleotide disphospho-sugar-binding domain-containing protein [Bacteroidota bacterium]
MKRTAVLMSIGTRGDIEPFLTLGTFLLRKQWRVIGVFPAQFCEEAEEIGLEPVGFDPAFLEMLEGSEGKAVMGGKGNWWQRASSLFRLAKKGMRLSREMMELQHEILWRERPELTLFHPKCLYGMIWGMVHPESTVLYSPVPMASHPVDFLGPTYRDDGRRINRFLFTLTVHVRALALKKFSKPYLPLHQGIDFSHGALTSAFRERQRSYYAVSPSLFERPDEWPVTAQITGYHERDKQRDWSPSPELLRFLDAYPEAVLVTFGSMTNPEPAKKTQAIVAALEQHGIPAILNTSVGGLQQLANAPASIHFVRYIPYDWAFPRVRAVVHHGGTGTTHTALKYGLPSMIVPHIIDQFFWARTIAARELGPEGIPIRKLNVARFAVGVQALVSEQRYRMNARKIMEAMYQEPKLEDLYQQIVVLADG